MSRKWRWRLRALFCGAVLEIGVLLGGAIRVEELQRLLRALNGQEIVEVQKEEDARGDGDKAGENHPSPEASKSDSRTSPSADRAKR